MRRTFFIMVLMWGNYVVAQNTNNFFHLRSVQSSLLMEFSSNTTNQIHTDSYGVITHLSQTSVPEVNSYLFQAQEYESELDLCFFPSRIYSTSVKRFNQPDPKSQFYSPYLFVGSDPVNNIDKDGNVSRPLVLYGLDNGKSLETTSFPNAHRYSLSDFIEKKIPPLDEWDGNVYVLAHMDNKKGRIELERANTEAQISMDEIPSGIHYDYMDHKNPRYFTEPGQKPTVRHFVAEVDADRFGRELKEFSVDRDVKLNNVVMAGCEGSGAAEAASTAFDSHSVKENGWLGDEVNFFGTKKGYSLFEMTNPGNYKHTSWVWTPRDRHKIVTDPIRVHGQEVDMVSYETSPGEKPIPAIHNAHEPMAEEMLFNGKRTPTAEKMVDHFFADY